MCLSFCGSGHWLRSIRSFSLEKFISAISVVVDDTSTSHDDITISSPQSIQTSFLDHSLCIGFSYLSNCDNNTPVMLQGFHDTLGLLYTIIKFIIMFYCIIDAGLFGGYIGGRY